MTAPIGFDPPQQDYRENPSLGEAPVPQGGPAYGQPIEPCAFPVSPQINQNDNPDASPSPQALVAPTLVGWSPEAT